jgi:2-keto-4-pentenoate hydratase/2-oxohepta-3-ene-1,7-dioic acid hydratase in catechol pathway
MDSITNPDHFALGTYRAGTQPAFVGLVSGDRVVPLALLYAAWLGSRRSQAGRLADCSSVLALLEDWDRHFEVLQTVHAFGIERGFYQAEAGLPVHRLAAITPLPPVTRPSKILNCASNYSAHLAEMRQYASRDGVDPATLYSGDKSSAQPYLFLKAPSSLIGATDDIVLPGADDQIDWEAELGVVIGTPARHVAASKALSHIAGYVAFNDVSWRNVLFRADRPNLRSDWLSSKSADTFGPCGPWMLPRAFVPAHGLLRLQLRVNGEVRQNGLAGEMIYSPEEQIEYASRLMTLESGDLLATGTLGGVGQGTGIFLNAGDLVETDVEGLGVARNRVVMRP